MNPQNTQWRKSLPARIVSVVLSILLLWATIGCLLLTIVCLSLSAYSHSGVPYDTLLVSTYDGTNGSDQSTTRYMLKQYIAVTQRDSAVGKDMYSKHFSHAATNLRFTVVDAEGEVVLSNNDQNLNESNALASAHEATAVRIGEERYEVQQHFDNLQEIFRVNLTQYMKKASDYHHWYFSNSIVDTAYQDGFLALVYTESVETLYFNTVAAANSYDYTEAYGDSVQWKIISPGNHNSGSSTTTTPTAESNSTTTAPANGSSTGNLGERPVTTSTTATTGADGGAMVEVQVTYNDRADNDYETIGLGDYYEYLEAGYHVELSDTELAQTLATGLDITIVGEAAQYEEYDLYLYLPREMTVDDAFASNIQLAEMLFSYRYILLGGIFICGLLTIAAMTGMCKVAGYVHDQDEPVCGWMHRIPYELLITVTVGVLAMALFAMDGLYYFSFSWKGIGIYIGGILLFLCAGAIYLLYTTAVRVKTKRFWESFITVRFLRFIYRLCSNRVAACILLTIGTGLLFLINAQAVISASNMPLFLLMTLALDFWVLLGLAYCIYAYEVLRGYTKRMEQGDFTMPKPPIPLIGIFKKHADSLTKVNEGIAISVAEQTKAERMRTALITNVSHDLKTPLTSIVNYVDLMKREPIENPTVTEYLDVLERQSARLKKLTEDLVEASKASTGNITVELQPTSIQVLAEQLIAEFEPRFSAKQLQIITNMPEEELFVSADSRLIWRVFDNLLGNVSKYAMPNTRVYLDVVKDADSVCVTLRNISQAVLHISPDELTERFVRGDASRNTEGSGLGLSIAKDLVRLQHGELQLQIDGDLFKAMVTLPVTAAPVRENIPPIDAPV